MFTSWTIKAVAIAIILVFIKQIRDYLLGRVGKEKRAALDQFKDYCHKRNPHTKIISLM